jgi:predicted DNA-binding transcriptional regulator AlpA
VPCVGVAEVGTVTSPIYQQTMSFKSFSKTYISAKEVAAMLGLAESTVYNGKAGTDRLRRVKQGRAVRWIKQDVEAYKERIESNPNG